MHSARRMTARRYQVLALLLSASGAAFAGTLSWVRASSGVCAFSEPCPFFLGQPACYTGFALFAVLFAASAFALVARVRSAAAVVFNLGVSTAGVLFAGTLTAREVAERGFALYGMGLPTCFYGSVFFAGLAVCSGFALARRRHESEAPRLSGGPGRPAHA